MSPQAYHIKLQYQTNKVNLDLNQWHAPSNFFLAGTHKSQQMRTILLGVAVQLSRNKRTKSRKRVATSHDGDGKKHTGRNVAALMLPNELNN